jgi:hypothetical protein
MSVAKHAENILCAWALRDHNRFIFEVSNALSSCAPGDYDSALEFERHEVLQTVAEYLESQPDGINSGGKLGAGFALLRHLARSGTGKAIKTKVRHATCRQEFQRPS